MIDMPKKSAAIIFAVVLLLMAVLSMTLFKEQTITLLSKVFGFLKVIG